MFNLKNINLVKALKRFPLTCLASIITALIIMSIIDIEEAETNLIRLAICASIGMVSLLAVKIASEAYTWKTSLLWGARIVVFLLLYLLYHFLPQDFDRYTTTAIFRLPFQLVALALFLHLLVAYIPFLRQGSQDDFWEYNKDIFLRFVESGFFSLFLFAGLSIAILALDKLFDIDIDGKYYAYLLVGLGGIFHTMYFLSKFPSIFYDNKIAEPIKPFLVFSQYILIPLVIVYLAILYAYGAQIAFRWELPKGWVSQLSLWFSVTGIFAYLLNYFNPQFSSFKLTSYYKKYFFHIMLVPVALIFVAIWRRIGDYGVTEERYIVAILGVWLLAISLYFIFSKAKKLKVIPISLSVVIGFSILAGPFNMFNATLKSQQKRLIASLEQENLLKDNQLIPAESSIQNNDSITNRLAIYEAIRFLDTRSDMSFINNRLDEKISFVNEQDTSQWAGNTYYPNGKILVDKLNIPHYFNTKVQTNNLESFHYSSIQEGSHKLGDSTYLVKLDVNNSKFRPTKENVFFAFNDESDGLVLYTGTVAIDTIMLNPIYASAKNFLDKTTDKRDYNLDPEVLRYHHVSDPCEIHFIFDSIDGHITKQGVIRFTSAYGTAIVTFIN